jgi:His/Glu/Gln/Arg/opine family amino acid ABC transporter permease subunit
MTLRWDWVELLLPGALLTLKLSAIAAVLAMALAFFVALGCISKSKPLVAACLAYIEIFRAIPLLVMLILVYFGLGSQLVELKISAFVVAVVVIVLNEGAYAADVYRSALLSIDRGQWHAAASIGLSYPKTLRLVVLPQFLRIVVAPTVNMLVYVIKGSALASLISVNELSLRSMLLVSETFRPLDVYVLSALVYLVITVPLGYVVYFIGGRAESNVAVDSRRWRRPSRRALAGSTAGGR